MTDDVQEKNGWRYPADLDIPTEPWYRYTLGDTEVRDLNWSGHIDLAHQAGLEELETEVVASGTEDSGIRYAAVKSTVVIDGVRYASVGGADTASNQVKDPEHVFSVAESRAIKRVVKKALNIRAADEGTGSATTDEFDDHGHPRDDPAGQVEKDTPDPPKPPEPPTADTDEDDAAW